MPLVGAQYLPHGNIILDPDNYYPQLKPATTECHDAMLRCAKEAKALKPDVIVMTFPHGITCDDFFTIYQHNEVRLA
jgi:aromatic ring-opening dioxygenase LigB subunit